MRVVADQNDGTLIVVQRVDQRLPAFDVQMVGRLIKDQDMRRINCRHRHEKSCLLPPGQPFDRVFHDIGANAGCPQPRTQRGWQRIWTQACHVLKRCLTCYQLVQLMLCKKPDTQFAGFADVPFHRGQPVGNQFGQGGLALTIHAQQGDAVILIQPQIDIAQHRLSVIAGNRLFNHHQGRRQRVG